MSLGKIPCRKSTDSHAQERAKGIGQEIVDVATAVASGACGLGDLNETTHRNGKDYGADDNL